MKSNLTPKQEKFCKKYIETGNASEAYRLAYDAKNMKPTSIEVEASRMLDNPIVTLRVKELQQMAVEKHLVTVESITAELDEAKELARQEKQASAMTGAIMGKAKLHGLITDKQETKHKYEDLNDDQLATIATSKGIDISKFRTH
jgi:phage terminase small subunit